MWMPTSDNINIYFAQSNTIKYLEKTENQFLLLSTGINSQ